MPGAIHNPNSMLSDSLPAVAIGDGLGGAVSTMSSREIAELTGKRHDNVRADIERMGRELSLIFQEKAESSDGGRPAKVYLLPKRESLILVSGYSLTMRAKIIDRWQELESAGHVALSLPRDYASALRALADKAEEVEAEREWRVALEHKVEEDAPKVAALDRISASADSITFTQASKLLGTKRADLTRWMSANGWIYRQNASWLAYKQHIQNGRLEYKEANYTDQKTGMACCKPYCHITPKGLTKLAMVFGIILDKAA